MTKCEIPGCEQEAEGRTDNLFLCPQHNEIVANPKTYTNCSNHNCNRKAYGYIDSAYFCLYHFEQRYQARKKAEEMDTKALFGHPNPEIKGQVETKKFDTGAVRSKDAEATRYDLISPIAMQKLAETYAEGSSKYGDYNWEKGMPVHDLLNHALRHIFLFLSGDRSEPHLPHAFWNLGAAIHSYELWPELNKNLRHGNCKAPNQ